MAAPAAPRLILVAEDDPGIREVLHWALDDAGYRLVPARDGAEALALAERWAPDLILLDVHMPLLDGPGFCRAYRAGGGQAPIVLLTAASQEAIRAAMEACGAVASIPKPFELAEVLKTIAGLVDGR